MTILKRLFLLVVDEVASSQNDVAPNTIFQFSLRLLSLVVLLKCYKCSSLNTEACKRGIAPKSQASNGSPGPSMENLLVLVRNQSIILIVNKVAYTRDRFHLR
jgi:hypothetical protein